MDPITFRTIDIVNIFAVALSPLVAILVSIWIQNRKEKRQQKLWLFSKLMETRHSPITDETVRALNMIEVVFHDDSRVRQLWREYFDMLSNQGLNNPQGWQQRQKKNLELITAIAGICGYGSAITHLDVDRVYYPLALEENARQQREITAAALLFLNSLQDFLRAQKTQVGPDIQTPSTVLPPKPG